MLRAEKTTGTAGAAVPAGQENGMFSKPEGVLYVQFRDVLQVDGGNDTHVFTSFKMAPVSDQPDQVPKLAGGSDVVPDGHV